MNRITITIVICLGQLLILLVGIKEKPVNVMILESVAVICSTMLFCTFLILDQ